MRIANVEGRLKLLVADGAVDVETASGGRFGHDPQAAYERFDDLRQWAVSVDQAEEPFCPEVAGPPSPSPRQVFAIGLNYLDHATESGFQAPAFPLVFTKYPSSFAGAVCDVTLPEGSIDWEVEVVAVIGKTAHEVPVAHGWDYVAGLTAVKIFRSGSCSAVVRHRSLDWPSRIPGSPRWVRQSSRSTRSTDPTTWNLAAP